MSLAAATRFVKTRLVEERQAPIAVGDAGA